MKSCPMRSFKLIVCMTESTHWRHASFFCKAATSTGSCMGKGSESMGRKRHWASIRTGSIHRRKDVSRPARYFFIRFPPSRCTNS